MPDAEGIIRFKHGVDGSDLGKVMRSSINENLDRTGEFLAQSKLVKPSLMPAMAEESISTASAIISSSKSTTPEIIQRGIEGGSKILHSGASKTSSRIIERNGNCS
jgi:hypothetical protein